MLLLWLPVRDGALVVGTKILQPAMLLRTPRDMIITKALTI